MQVTGQRIQGEKNGVPDAAGRFFHLFSDVAGQYRQHRFKINRKNKYCIDKIRMNSGLNRNTCN